MSGFGQRMIGAALLETRVYEEVEADQWGTGQALGVVLLASAAGGIGLAGRARDPQAVLVAVVGALVGWMAWAALTYLLGTRVFPESQTHADLGELLRTIAFASSPGLLRALGVIPVVGWPIYVGASIWMLVAMVVAIRQALDYSSTGRAIAVCALGWLLSLAIALVLGLVFSQGVS
jgi:hypothetical protein